LIARLGFGKLCDGLMSKIMKAKTGKRAFLSANVRYTFGATFAGVLEQATYLSIESLESIASMQSANFSLAESDRCWLSHTRGRGNG